MRVCVDMIAKTVNLQLFRILNSKGFSLVVDPRCRNLGVQPPAVEEVLITI